MPDDDVVINWVGVDIEAFGIPRAFCIYRNAVTSLLEICSIKYILFVKS